MEYGIPQIILEEEKFCHNKHGSVLFALWNYSVIALVFCQRVCIAWERMTKLERQSCISFRYGRPVQAFILLQYPIWRPSHWWRRRMGRDRGFAECTMSYGVLLTRVDLVEAAVWQKYTKLSVVMRFFKDILALYRHCSCCIFRFKLVWCSAI